MAVVAFIHALGVNGQVAGNDSVIRVGITQNEPKMYFDDEQQPAGIFVEIIREIALNEGWQIEFVKGTWPEHIENLRDGKIDLLPDVAFTIDRNERFIFNKITVIESWSNLYVNPEVKVERFSDINGKKIAFLEGSVQQSRFGSLMKGFGYQFETVTAKSFSEAFSMVSIGVADAVVVNRLFGEMHYMQFGLNQTPVVFNPVSLHFAVNDTGNVYLINTIDKYLEQWIETPNSFYYQTLVKFGESQFIAGNNRSHFIWIIWIIVIISLTGIVIFILLFMLNRKEKAISNTNRLVKTEEEKFRTYIEFAPFGIFVANEKGECIDVNPTSCSLTGYSKEELLNKTIIDNIAEEGHAMAMDHFNRVVSEGKATEILPYITKNGEKRFWKVDAVKINEQLLLGMVTDVTSEKISQSKLNWYGKIFDQSINEIYLLDIETYRFTEVNMAAILNTGYSISEFRKLTPLNLLPDFTLQQFEALIEPLVTGKKEWLKFELKHKRKDGTVYDAEIHLQIIEYEVKKQFSAIVIDITERKKTEQELHRLKLKLEHEIAEQTLELKNRVTELEQFREVTIERELRMEQLRREIEVLKKSNQSNTTTKDK